MTRIREKDTASTVEWLGRELFGFMLRLGASTALITLVLHSVAGSDDTSDVDEFQTVAQELSLVPASSIDLLWSDR